KDVCLVSAVRFSPLLVEGAVSGWPDRRRRWPAWRSRAEHDQARRRRERHGFVYPWARRIAPSTRQTDLYTAVVYSHGAMVLRHLLKEAIKCTPPRTNTERPCRYRRSSNSHAPADSGYRCLAGAFS